MESAPEVDYGNLSGDASDIFDEEPAGDKKVTRTRDPSRYSSTSGQASAVGDVGKPSSGDAPNRKPDAQQRTKPREKSRKRDTGNVDQHVAAVGARDDYIEGIRAWTFERAASPERAAAAAVGAWPGVNH